MDDQEMSAEELILGMRADEIVELLAESGVAVTAEQAEILQGMVHRYGSLDAAMEALSLSADGLRDAA